MESFSIISAYFLDLVIGDPRWFPHPVKGMGKLIIFLDQKLRTGQRIFLMYLKGIILTILVVGISALCAFVLLNYFEKINYILEITVWILLSYTTLACGDLYHHVKDIKNELKNKNIEGAREKLSLIVGRDTKDLTKEKIIIATIESIAESTNDGIIAPLFYLFLGGPVLAISYKAINTLDSMVGYKNEQYLYFGWFSARVDDAANFIPARITGILIVISSFFLGYDFKKAFKIMARDGQKHHSPNSGISEAAMAGGLGIKLGGTSKYEGIFLEKPYIGDDKNIIQIHLINKALKITFVSSLIMVIAGVILK